MRKPRRVATYLLLLGCLFCLLNFTIRFVRKVPSVRPVYSGSVIWQWSRFNGQINQSQNSTDVASINLPLNEVSDANFRQFIHRVNLAQLVRNEDQFGKLPSPSDPNLSTTPDSAFVIQIHSRLENLRLLIESLKRVKYIESSLLVFSTDFVSDELIELIESVRFARTIQIYYPHSSQVFPDTFPGNSSGDCTGKLSRRMG
ncbi:alpha-1,6-mannosyl-glycoprotein beta-1,2-N-acetylglucosaminyltransferase [Paragonimus westermani]|uniref:Alpha-1,6-mannosyl-glycoprotein beta-1,2-N-acetylglucosaminyltransferase n=1 Tax=Paragonimus westermani TaxID=34504 RepID=A0A5J4NWY8_9TREM|nr:alpha-1,6-mannosyl-glycoprotein beta-1,2-N-acetylglucosaminyltransferase [Paragonimus westermani]